MKAIPLNQYLARIIQPRGDENNQEPRQRGHPNDGCGPSEEFYQSPSSVSPRHRCRNVP